MLQKQVIVVTRQHIDSYKEWPNKYSFQEILSIIIKILLRCLNASSSSAAAATTTESGTSEQTTATNQMIWRKGEESKFKRLWLMPRLPRYIRYHIDTILNGQTALILALKGKYLYFYQCKHLLILNVKQLKKIKLVSHPSFMKSLCYFSMKRHKNV